MRSPNDPLVPARRRARATWLAGAVAVLGCALWAFGPWQAPDAPSVTPLRAGSERVVIEAGIEPIDQNAFLARLWDQPAAPDPHAAEPAARAEPEPMPRFQLIGITRDQGRLYAVLYDPQADRLFTVGDGDSIGHHTVTAISESGVELSDGRSTRWLALREDRS